MPVITTGYDHYTRHVVGRSIRAVTAPRFTVTRAPQRAADFVANHFLLLAAHFMMLLLLLLIVITDMIK